MEKRSDRNDIGDILGLTHTTKRGYFLGMFAAFRCMQPRRINVGINNARQDCIYRDPPRT